MTPSQYQRLAPLFEAAMELPPSERVKFAHDLCSGDAELLRELLSLLRAAAQPSDSFDHPVARMNRRFLQRAMATVESPGSSASNQLVIERFKILRRVGRGGMGKVYQAIDRETGGVVALKLIRTRGAFAEHQRMCFLKEARSVAALRHPNIVEVYDIGQAQGHLYMVMEYLEGRSLRMMLESGWPIQGDTVLRIMSQIARALAFAHAHGVIHGDIKPDNIMVCSDGFAKLVDFGVARQIGLSNDRVRGGGTISYMAPERFEPTEATAVSDVWSLGVTLFECLSGQRPFATAEEIRGSLEAPRLYWDSPLAGEVGALIARTLVRDSGQRVQNADEVATELERLLDVDGRTPANPAAEGAKQNDHGVYELPGLGFRSEAVGALETGTRRFRWAKRRRVWMASRDRCLGIEPRPIVRGKKRSWIGRFVAALLLAFQCVLVWAMFWGGPTVDPYLTRYFKLCLVATPIAGILILLLHAPAALCSWLCILDRLSVCRSCHVAMRRTSSWARFAKDQSEVLYGQSDCIAALRHGLWQEAAKLLALHGREVNSAYSSTLIAPARFRLDFFECVACGDHAARLTTEDRFDDAWRAREAYFEAYWRGLGQPSLVARDAGDCFARGLMALMDAVALRVQAGRAR